MIPMLNKNMGFISVVSRFSSDLLAVFVHRLTEAKINRKTYQGCSTWPFATLARVGIVPGL